MSTLEAYGRIPIEDGITGQTRVNVGGEGVALPTRALLAARVLALIIASLLLAAGISYERSSPAHPVARTGSRAPQGLSRLDLSRLPLAAQGAVSQTLGNEDPAYGVRASAAGLSAEIPAQRIRSTFSGSGVTVSSGSAQVKMRLSGIGYGSQLAPVAAATPRAYANRVTYLHAGVAEWYANGPLGLEQGFTIARAPRAGARAPAGQASGGPLTLAVAVSGNVTSSLEASGRSVLFAGGGASFLYTGLVVADARGHALHSWLALAQGRLLVHIDARGARYPLHVDPFLQQGEKLTGGAEESGEASFGYTVALSSDGNTALVGAPGDDEDRGAAFVFTRSGVTWSQQGEKLTAHGTYWNGFGYSVALSGDGDTALISAAAEGAPSVYVFSRSGGSWREDERLTGTGSLSPVNEAPTVAISADGDTALMGCRDDNEERGAVWVFVRSGEKWSQQGAKLTGAGESGKGEFGFGLALSSNGSTALIGGNEDGSAWVFTRSGEKWSQQGPKLEGGEASGAAAFSESVALSGNGETALIGQVGDHFGSGAVWVFTRAGEKWSQQGPKLTGGAEQGGSYFGSSVALSNDGSRALIGDYADDDGGSAASYVRSGETWKREGAKFTGGFQDGYSGFGLSVALSAEGTTALIGGRWDDDFVGAAWVFAKGPATETQPATEVTRTEAQLNATVNPDGESVTACIFEYGPTRSYGSTASCSPAPGSGESAVAVSAAIKELSPDTTYHFRIVATNGSGTTDGADATLTTLQTFDTGESTEVAKPATAKDEQLSAEASGGTGALTVGLYGPDIGGPALRDSTGAYFDVYRSAAASFTSLQFKDCELGGARAMWWYDPQIGWQPIPEPIATYTAGSPACITVTITEATTPSLAQLTGTRFKDGEPPGAQQFGKCEPAKKALYTESNCLTVAEKKGVPDHKGKYEWLPVPVGCFAEKDGLYTGSTCSTVAEKKGVPDHKGKYEKGSSIFSATIGSVRLEPEGSAAIECASGSASGSESAVKAGTETLTLHGCKRGSNECTSADQTTGTIATGELLTLVYEEEKKYYFNLSGIPLAQFSCGSANYTLDGEVAGETSGDVDVMSSKAEAVFEPDSGYQGLTLENAAGTEPAELEATMDVSFAQPGELDTRVKP